jgi:hypothetical protein
VRQETKVTRIYEAPTMTVLGTVHALTQADPIPKHEGPSDGFTFNNISITHYSN